MEYGFQKAPTIILTREEGVYCSEIQSYAISLVEQFELNYNQSVDDQGIAITPMLTNWDAVLCSFSLYAYFLGN